MNNLTFLAETENFFKTSFKNKETDKIEYLLKRTMNAF